MINYGLITCGSLVSVALWPENRIVLYPRMVLMVMVDVHTIAGRGENLGTTVDRRITEPSKDLAKIFAFTFSKVEII